MASQYSIVFPPLWEAYWTWNGARMAVFLYGGHSPHLRWLHCHTGGRGGIWYPYWTFEAGFSESAPPFQWQGSGPLPWRTERRAILIGTLLVAENAPRKKKTKIIYPMSIRDDWRQLFQLIAIIWKFMSFSWFFLFFFTSYGFFRFFLGEWLISCDCISSIIVCNVLSWNMYITI